MYILKSALVILWTSATAARSIVIRVQEIGRDEGFRKHFEPTKLSILFLQYRFWVIKGKSQ